EPRARERDRRADAAHQRREVMRHALHACVAALALAAFASSAFAQNYPTKPVRVVVPFAPAGTSDFIARVLGKKLGEELSQTFVVDNRGGAGGTIGADI